MFLGKDTGGQSTESNLKPDAASSSDDTLKKETFEQTTLKRLKKAKSPDEPEPTVDPRTKKSTPSTRSNNSVRGEKPLEVRFFKQKLIVLSISFCVLVLS